MGRLDVSEDLPGGHVAVPRESIHAAAAEIAKRLRRPVQELGSTATFRSMTVIGGLSSSGEPRLLGRPARLCGFAIRGSGPGSGPSE
ncbi:hypothetical protein DLJ59_27725 [Micromonospora inaquosa]|uniref:Uncharacterized protein n=1 Tax=Micromonospora inaquosa TaxID=2203716 RepID=A0A3N9WBE2_9ACTN|nr:hypothetical protein DLJ59_27725 [Micromonospora inaquosa]